MVEKNTVRAARMVRSTTGAAWRLVLRERILFSGDARSNGTAKETGGKDYDTGSARCYSQEYWSRTEVRHGGPGDNKTDERAGVPLTTGPKNRSEFGPAAPNRPPPPIHLLTTCAY